MDLQKGSVFRIPVELIIYKVIFGVHAWGILCEYICKLHEENEEMGEDGVDPH